MSVAASLELCRELYELSGWKDTPLLLVIGTTQGGAPYSDVVKRGDYEAMGYVNVSSTHPAYDLGYLLRKIAGAEGYIELLSPNAEHPHWDCNAFIGDQFYGGEDDMIEDAAAKLAIELFKRGILK